MKPNQPFVFDLMNLKIGKKSSTNEADTHHLRIPYKGSPSIAPEHTISLLQIELITYCSNSVQSHANVYLSSLFLSSGVNTLM